jgi:uncharacterized protein YktB (UPF0637 family)
MALSNKLQLFWVKTYEMFQRLQTVKKAEILCGIQIPRDKIISMSGEDLISTFHDVFVKLLPLYKLK